jgi:hypothetical protein
LTPDTSPPARKEWRKGRPRIFTQHQRAAELRDAGARWREIARELNTPYPTLLSHADEIKALMKVPRKGYWRAKGLAA